MCNIFTHKIANIVCSRFVANKLTTYSTESSTRTSDQANQPVSLCSVVRRWLRIYATGSVAKMVLHYNFSAHRQTYTRSARTTCNLQRLLLAFRSCSIQLADKKKTNTYSNEGRHTHKKLLQPLQLLLLLHQLEQCRSHITDEDHAHHSIQFAAYAASWNGGHALAAWTLSCPTNHPARYSARFATFCQRRFHSAHVFRYEEPSSPTGQD